MQNSSNPTVSTFHLNLLVLIPLVLTLAMIVFSISSHPITATDSREFGTIEAAEDGK